MTRPPPLPLYPDKYDSDETLFLVYNTSESYLAKENTAWSEEIEIIPSEEKELWAENGFANIGGELFYYNSVEKKIINGKERIFKFKECVRNLGGEKTKYNDIGEKVRGFVIAEHHNQLVDAVLNIEDFIGRNFSENTKTLDYRIRNLENVPVIFDDYNCPDVSFTFDIIDENPSTGILASFNIDINGAFISFKLDFGDGNYTSSLLQGTHTYPPNSTPNPVFTVYNDNCSTTFTPTNRNTGVEPVVAEFNPPLEIPIPPPPEIPPILIAPFVPIENKYNIPPIVFPCLDIGGLGSISIPSLISTIGISPIRIEGVPSTISVIGISPIKIAGPNNEPINIPSTIKIETSGIPVNINIPSKVEFGPAPVIPETIFFDSAVPELKVKWDTPPSLVCTVVIQCPGSGGSGGGGVPLRAQSNNWIDPLEDPSISASIEVDSIGIPSIINVIAPNIPPIVFDTSNFPSTIKVESSIPEQIKIISPDFVIPSEIKLTSDSKIPSAIKLDCSGVPSSIKIESDIPEFIGLKIPDDFPREIKINASEIPSQIQVVGIPPVIELKGSIPSTIQLLMPEKPEIEMVYKGAPIDVKVQLDISKIAGDGQNLNCVAIVPCK